MRQLILLFVHLSTICVTIDLKLWQYTHSKLSSLVPISSSWKTALCRIFIFVLPYMFSVTICLTRCVRDAKVVHWVRAKTESPINQAAPAGLALLKEACPGCLCSVCRQLRQLAWNSQHRACCNYHCVLSRTECLAGVKHSSQHAWKQLHWGTDLSSCNDPILRSMSVHTGQENRAGHLPHLQYEAEGSTPVS